jgi:DNA-directed RNA polymerase III subunit RPC8
MFFRHTVTDTIALPPASLALPTHEALEQELDAKYPGRVWMDVGLVVGRTPDDLKQVSDGVCVAGQAATHHTCTFRLLVFRPFLEEVCVGRICASKASGLQVTLGGFFDQIYIPAYWMLRPSIYEASSGLWVWTPPYEEDEDEDDGEGDGDGDGAETKDADAGANAAKAAANTPDANTPDANRYEMPIGAMIRFKVKSIQFARVTQTAKGRQATFRTTDHGLQTSSLVRRQTSSSMTSTTNPANAADLHSSGGGPSEVSSRMGLVRRRSSSVGLDNSQAAPPPMKILASICEDGLGLMSWWQADQEDDADACSTDANAKENDANTKVNILPEEDPEDVVMVEVADGVRVKREEEVVVVKTESSV